MSRYARLVLALSLAWTPGLMAKDYTFDVTGPRGQDDPHGRPSYSPGDTPGTAVFGRGADGDDGGHAVEVAESGRLRKKGWDGGSLILNLSVADDKEIVIDGKKTEPEVTRAERVTGRMPLKASTSLRFRAGGGAGADGGDGGRGQDGGKGSRGRDASGRIPGTDGARGGDGGNEGHSTNGGDAGVGGKIVLRLPIQDTDVAMLFDERDVSGNRGGSAGRGHGPGDGGDGGDGGSSDGYYTTETRSVPDTVTTDEDGNETRTSNPDETYQEWHHTPGGSSGPDGYAGSPSNRTVYDGRNSQAGSFAFEVTDEKGKTRSYDEPYYVELLPGFTLEGSLNGPYLDRASDFFEPGETITIRKMRIKNVGGSPTPAYQKIKLFLSDNDWILTNSDEVTLPKVLQPGEEYDFGDEPITFKLKEKPRAAAGLMRETQVVGPEAYVTRVGRTFNNFDRHAARQIRVQYPIEITPLQSLTSIAPGEGQETEFLVTNISKQTIGSGFSFEGLRYARTEYRRTAGSAAADAFVISRQRDGGGVSPENGISDQLEGLKPGESKVIRIFVGLRPTAEPYSKVDVQPELFLELPSGDVQRIQFEPYQLNVAKVFEPGGRVLLIANAKLDRKVLQGLEAVAAIKTVNMKIWDFSRYGFFNFSHQHLDMGSIFELYRGGTVIILGNQIETPGGPVAAHRLLQSNEIIEAGRRYGVKVVIMDPSEDSIKTVQRLTEPLPVDAPNTDVTRVREFTSFEQYFSELQTALHRVQEDMGDDTAFLGASRFAVHHTPLFWGGPKPEALQAAGLMVLKNTDKYLPESQPYVDTRYAREPVQVGRRFLFWPTWNLGTIDVLRSTDDAKTSVVAVKMTSKDLENPEFILGEAFSTAFDLALNFTTKLDLLNDVITGKFAEEAAKVELPESLRHVFTRDPLEYGRILTHSLLLDLIHEQRMIRPLEFKTAITKAQLWDKLDLLKRLTQNTYSQFKLDPTSREGQLLVDLIVSMRFFNREITTFWQRVGMWWPAVDPNVQVSEVTKDMLGRLISTVFEDPVAATQYVENQLAAWRKSAKDKGLTREQMLAALDRNGLEATLVRDGQVNRTREERLRDDDRQRQLIASEKKRERRAIEIQGSVESETAKRRLDNTDCQSLLASYVPEANPIPDPLSNLNAPAKDVVSGPSGLPPKIRTRR